MKIVVTGEAPCDLVPVRRAIRRAVEPYGVPADAEVALAFIDDERMRRLNRKHRGKPRTTDVLSFGQRLPARAKGARAAAALKRDVDGSLDLGDIVISGSQAARQAARARHSLQREIAFLAAHGALHLLGFEDETRAGYAEMVRLGNEAIGATVRSSGRGSVRSRGAAATAPLSRRPRARAKRGGATARS